MISKTTVKPDFVHLMSQLVHAETFHMNRMNNILYDFSVEDREDGRSWLTVDVYVELAPIKKEKKIIKIKYE